MSTLGSATPCPTGCGRHRPPGKAMCRRCWYRVTKPTQTELWRSWRSWQDDFGDPGRLHRYEDALAAAVEEAKR